MTRKRVSKEERQQRHEWEMKQIDRGVGFSEHAFIISETWGVHTSERPSRRVFGPQRLDGYCLRC